MKNTIRVERAKLKITQAKLAEQVGVSRQAINNIETGKYIPTTILAIKIAMFFSKKVEDIFQIEDED